MDHRDRSPERLCTIAREAAASVAGPLVDAFRGSISARTKASAHDLVTEHDVYTEGRLVELLTAAVPGSSVLGEEGGRIGPGHDDDGTRVGWIVDPIDGTSNFAHGFEMFSVSIAATLEDEVVAAVVHAPAAGLAFSAVRGRGAQLVDRHGVRGLHDPSPRAQEPETALNLVTSFPAAEALELEGPAAAEDFSRLVTTYSTVRRVVSGALELCFAAAGWADAVLTVDARPWDVAAGQLILQEAGGRLIPRDDFGRPVDPPHLAPHCMGLAPGVEAPTAIEVLEEICARRSAARRPTQEP
ncbi:inositol monophosphatase family protein [Nesterenkonia marinintestina]|uniref:inositol monophosphatase family protein n=1 Tax=Nesterenkonia marinintestina TaxID=2979865 RepID=UPI0021BE91D2|nr:inositol monophosphatase family protein [Nesterenkonia sp. GX14115]